RRGADVRHDDADDASLGRADLVEMIGLDPAEVVIRALRVEPVVVAREKREPLAVVRLIDALGILIGLRTQIREPTVHERLWRAHHRDGETRCGDTHGTGSARAATGGCRGFPPCDESGSL